jgi:hypothetical protein
MRTLKIAQYRLYGEPQKKLKEADAKERGAIPCSERPSIRVAEQGKSVEGAVCDGENASPVTRISGDRRICRKLIT